MIEQWKTIKGFEDYEVSSLGRVKSKAKHYANGKTRDEIILRSNIDRNGYEYVMLYKNARAKMNLVHRLVAEAFIENPQTQNKEQVNHLNFCKTDNAVENLEWCSAKENAVYNIIGNRVNFETSRKSKLNFDKVLQAKRMYQGGISQTQIARIFGVNSSTISRAVRGKRWARCT